MKKAEEYYSIIKSRLTESYNPGVTEQRSFTIEVIKQAQKEAIMTAVNYCANAVAIVEVCEECGSRNLGSKDRYKFCLDCNAEINGVSEIDKLSILNIEQQLKSQL